MVVKQPDGEESMKLVAFKNGFGFLVYDPDKGAVTTTLEVDLATEATLEDWLEVAFFDLETCILFSRQSHKLSIPPTT